jgi:GxxExxY protein
MIEPSQEHDSAARQIVDSAFTVHTNLGPGLLESVCEQCLEQEQRSRSLIVARRARIKDGIRRLIN